MIHKGEIYLTDRYRGGKKDYGRPVLILSSAENNRETGSTSNRCRSAAYSAERTISHDMPWPG